MISCKEYAASEKKRLAEAVKASKYRLDIFQIGDNPASNAYVRGKLKDCEEVGIHAEMHKLGEGASQDALEQEMIRQRYKTHGIILQLPVPDGIDAKKAVRKAVWPEDDVDGMVYGDHTPCTARGIIDWLDANHVRIEGANAVVIGRGEIAGKAIAEALLKRNATITVCHSHTDPVYLRYLCGAADIVVVAVGKPHWFDIDCPDAIVIDVGISRLDGHLAGDVAPSTKAKYVTPVPGGVGLLTRVGLLKNIIE